MIKTSQTKIEKSGTKRKDRYNKGEGETPGPGIFPKISVAAITVLIKEGANFKKLNYVVNNGILVEYCVEKFHTNS